MLKAIRLVPKPTYSDEMLVDKKLKDFMQHESPPESQLKYIYPQDQSSMMNRRHWEKKATVVNYNATEWIAFFGQSKDSGP